MTMRDDHEHEHGHVGGHEHVHGPTGPATVMADVGGDVGAAVVYTPATLVGRELEIRPVGRAWDGTHTAVRAREVGTSTVWAGFFGALHAGRYEVRLRGDGSRPIDLTVNGASVTEATYSL
jgi:hypothetical protein